MNFRQVRKKIKTVTNVKKITSAMEMVSAVKMRKAQQAALDGREYRYALDDILQRIIANTGDLSAVDIPWLQKTDGNTTLYVFVTSNKGLCGAFHSNLFRYFIENKDDGPIEYITIGEKGAQFVSYMKGNIVADFSDSQSFVDSVSPVFNVIQDKYLSGQYKRIAVVYNKFINTMQSEPTIETLLPVSDISRLEESDEKEISAQYVIEPSVDELLKPLIEEYIMAKLRGAIIDSEAAEHSARMLAMKAATENAEDVVHELTLLRNKLRQKQITNELLDMIAAKESTS